MASGTERRARRSRAQWQTLIARGERSALGIGAFCRAEGVSTASFYSWRQRLRESAPDERSAAVGAPAPAFLDLGALHDDAGRWEIELALGDGVVLRLRRG
jgi:transposase-like protein